MKNSNYPSRSKGISLIELMISLVIGLVVVGAVIVSMIGSNNAGKYQAAYSQMNEDAQIGLSILSREVRLAGFSQPTGYANTAVAGATPTFNFAFTTVTRGVFGCDNTFVNPKATALACTAGTSTTPAFEVIYEADAATTVLTAGLPSDCLGQSIAGPPYIARNRYYISATASGRPELYCASDKAGGGAHPLIENIEAMRLWYGLPVAANPRQVVRYVSATDVNTAGITEWDNVISVRICILVRSAEPVLNSGGEDTLTYRNCNSDVVTSSDRLLRRAYFTTSTLRRQMPF